MGPHIDCESVTYEAGWQIVRSLQLYREQGAEFFLDLAKAADRAG